MAPPLPKTPNLARPASTGTVFDAFKGLAALTASLVRVLSEMAFAINGKLDRDGGGAMTAPFPLYAVEFANLPDEATYIGTAIFVTDDIGGPVMAYSDGTDWRRVSDGAVVSDV